MRLILSVWLVLALAGPAQAADAVPVQGQMTFHATPLLGGNATFSSPEGALDLERAYLDGVPVALSWSSAMARHVASDPVAVGPGDGTVTVFLNDERPAVRSFREGGVEAIECGPACQVLLFGLGQEGSSVGVSGALDGPLTRTASLREYWGVESGHEQGGAGYSRAYPVGTLAMASPAAEVGDATRLLGFTASAEGPLGLLVVDALVTVREGDRTWDIDARHARTSVGALGTDLLRQEHASYALITMEGARLLLPEGAPALFLAESSRLGLQGRLHAPSVTGDLFVAGASWALDRESLVLEGSLVALLDAKAVDGTRSAVGRAAGQTLPPEAEAMEGGLEGEAHVVRMGGQIVVQAASVPLGVAATGLTLAALLGLLWVALQRGGFAILYSRISRAGVLDNPRRRQVYDLLRERPGLTATELSETTGLARVVVQHHLRMLETHSLATPRAEGRRRAYFLSGDLPAADVLACHAILRDPSRRRLAQALAAAPEPLTQAQLAQSTGLSARLVSYHLGHLGQVGLVNAEGTLPRLYRPTTLLPRALATLSHAPG